MGLETEVASTEQMTVDKAWEKREREESRMWEVDSHTPHTLSDPFASTRGEGALQAGPVCAGCFLRPAPCCFNVSPCPTPPLWCPLGFQRKD